MKASETQVGGDHYSNMKIDVLTFCEENNLTPTQAKVIKYVVRHLDKGGLEDLKKARHIIEWMMEFYYGYSPSNT